TAICAGTPNARVRIGVIREPPPTPVAPTTNPTKAPLTINCSTTRKLQKLDTGIRTPVGTSRATGWSCHLATGPSASPFALQGRPASALGRGNGAPRSAGASLRADDAGAERSVCY